MITLRIAADLKKIFPPREREPEHQEMLEKIESDISKEDVTPDENGRLMSIREVSALTDVPPHTIRFWEKEMPNILRPERTAGGQRRYDTEMTERIRMIKRLSDEKRYSLATIREYLSATGGLARFQPNSNPKRDAQAEHVIQFIVDEITEVLKERLRKLLMERGFSFECASTEHSAPALDLRELSGNATETGDGFMRDSHLD